MWVKTRLYSDARFAGLREEFLKRALSGASSKTESNLVDAPLSVGASRGTGDFVFATRHGAILRIRRVAPQLVQPDDVLGIARRAPIAARRQRASGADLRPVGEARALELARFEETVEKDFEPLL